MDCFTRAPIVPGGASSEGCTGGILFDTQTYEVSKESVLSLILYNKYKKLLAEVPRILGFSATNIQIRDGIFRFVWI